MPMLLRWLDKTHLPVEADGLLPAAFAGLDPITAAKLPVRVGNRPAELGDLFAVQATDHPALVLEGDLRHVRGIGRGMAGGALVVRGAAGPYLAAGMSGGTVEVFGDTGDWAGAEMLGGVLRVRGRAGRFLGASRPGSRLGMRDGVVLVDGDAGDDAGRRMRRGLIAVGGSVGEGFGRDLIAGTLLAFGPIGRYAGMGMKRGTVAAFGGDGVDLLPTFAPAGRFRFPFLTVYLKSLDARGFPVPAAMFSAEMGRYNGDLAGGGRGEVLVRAGSNER